MSVRRALVDCVVLSLQDACLYYPCCKSCFSRINTEQQDMASRCRCSKCGYICLREQVDYRYRLSVRVARDSCIFGVTVFGSCLNTFFGIHASGLQRLVDNLDGPVGASTRPTLLVKAAKDCFIGRHFIFGIKLTETESKPWLGGLALNGFGSKDMVQFIASQMILPDGTGLRGCTVASYYRILLQKAAEYELGSTDPTKTRPPETTLLLIPHHSPASSFNSATLSASGLLSKSLQSSQYQDCTLTPTPPWQQSLGLVTSSAEQEEDCSTQDSEEESRQTDNNKTPHCKQVRTLENHKVTAARAPSPLLSLECTCSSLTFAKYPYSFIEKAVGDTPILNTWFSRSPTDQNSSRAKGVSTRQLAETSLSSSLAWEDLPFSESLTEFVCVGNKDFDIVSESELNVKNRKETSRNNLEVRSQDKNVSAESTSVCNTQITDTHSQILLDITNTPALNGRDRRDLSDQVCKNPAVCVNKSQARNIECNQEGEKVYARSFENKEEAQWLEGDTYNCSADLFSSSLVIDPNTTTLNTHAETIGPSTPDKRHLRREKVNVPHSTSDKQKLISNNCINRDHLNPTGMHDLDFIPPSQSTPIVKVAVATGSPASSYRALTLVEFTSDSHRDSCAFHGNLPDDCVSANQLSQCGKKSTKENLVWTTTSGTHSHRFTPKRRFWKPDKLKNHLLAQQHLRAQEGALNTGSTGKMNHKYDSSNCYVTVCDYEENEGIVHVPPTPAAKRRLGVKLRRRGRTESSSSSRSSSGFTQEGPQEDGVKSKRTLLDQSQRGPAQTGTCGRDADDEGTLDGSNRCLLDDENEACDWSRDLFSDSI